MTRRDVAEGTEVTDSQEERRRGGRTEEAVRLVGVRSTPTAAFGGQSNGLFFVIFVSFVVQRLRTPFASVPSFLL